MKNILLMSNFVLVATILTSCTVPKIDKSRDDSIVLESEEHQNIKEEREALEELKVKEEVMSSFVESKKNNLSRVEQVTEILTTKEASENINSEKKISEINFKFGKAPQNYRVRIKSFLKKENIVSQDVLVKYIFSRPAKAIKKDKSWRGWFVDVDILKQANKQKIVKTKFYTILFQQNKILEVIEAGSKKGIIIKIK